MRWARLSWGEIDLDSRTFVFSFPPRGDLLRESIHRFGLLEPPVVARAGEKFLPVAGEGRLLAWKSLGEEEVPVFILPETDPLRLQEMALESNLWRGLNLVEKAEVVVRFRRYLAPEEVVSGVFPRLGLSPTPEGYFFLEEVARSSGRVRQALATGKLPPKVARLLFRYPSEWRERIWNFLEKLGLSVSEKREALEGILDLARREERPPEELLQELEDRTDRGEFLSELRRRLRPHLFQTQQKLSRLRERVRTAEALLETPPALETDTLSLTLRFRSEEELRSKLERLLKLLP